MLTVISLAEVDGDSTHKAEPRHGALPGGPGLPFSGILHIKQHCLPLCHQQCHCHHSLVNIEKKGKDKPT